MTLPIAFLLGLLVVVGHREVGAAVPGASTLDGVAGWALALMVPALLAGAARNGTVRALVTGRRPLVPPRALRWLSVAAVPLSLHAFYEFGAYGDLIDRVAPESHLAQNLLAIAPLYAAELPRLLLTTFLDALLESGVVLPTSFRVAAGMLPRWAEVAPAMRLRLGWPLLTLLPVVLLGGALDLAQLDRAFYAVLVRTSAGLTCGTILFLFAAAVLLPTWFRLSFGLHRRMPEPVGELLRDVSGRLGFAPRRLFVLPTGQRAMNAMMVGPLPAGRLLCLTDGLLQNLDARSLMGVLAHEIGHARMGHPGILMLFAVVVPLMLLAPLNLLDGQRIDVLWQALAMVVYVGLLWGSVRALARRFEFEADVASVRALGAEPCSDALRTVSRIARPARAGIGTRLMSLHPEERQRLDVMSRYEHDETFRRRFDGTSRRLRLLVAALLVVATAVGGWCWSISWPYERIVVQHYVGDFVGARAAIDELGEVPQRWRAQLRELGEQADCALELLPDARGVDWPRIRDALAEPAWLRGEQVLLAEGPAAARPWFALSIAARPDAPAVERAVHAWCEAAASGEPERMEAIADVIRRDGVPARLEPVFRRP